MFSEIFSLSYLFNPNPQSGLNSISWIFLSMFVITIICGWIYGRQIKRNNSDRTLRKIMGKVPGRLTIIGVLGLAYFFAHWQQMPYLSMRFIPGLLIILLIILLIRARRVYYKEYPKALKHQLEKVDSLKYLPKQKKKKKNKR